ncbi:Aminoacylase-1, putative [Pediculus humanus corporis]|uniref:N-acyl-aliphatic-L-amino acid amidohydrolase n=1 Tax=Pediculus humanus subsp. corporis TaxID=121224 RepID=E0VB00_PEDHC|nr:Aminoacylase-1, putative [Pediculus humanus corporis]EEB10556.1 Aminoacylase-1, putative [Pediculus humanus corporis]
MTDSGLEKKLNEIAVENFRKYLRIPSVQPNVNYEECVKFLTQQGKELNLDVKIFEIVKNKPIVILTKRGTNSRLPSILLNSHMDVVPVFPEFWKYGPFDANVDENGNIYGRGAQDMKCVAIQYLEALRRLIRKNVQFKRDIHLSFVPDEEIGGIDGMKKFVYTSDFTELNVGFALDEGYSSPTSTVYVFNAERNIWQIEFICSGSEGHGSLLLENTAGEKMEKLISKIMSFRQTQVEKLKLNNNLTIGDVTTVNLTMLKGGVEANVIPPRLSATFDFRLSLDVDLVDFENQIKKWIKDSGDGIEMKWIQKNSRINPTKVDESNLFWMKIKEQFDLMNIKYKISTFPGGTDGRYCREVGIPVIGLSPIMNTPVLLHAHDEFLNKDIFIKGIDIYEKLIPAIANQV